MTLPAILLGFLLSTAYGAAFHLWKGGGAGRLLLCLALAWAGFAAGQYLGDVFDFSLARLGGLQAGLGSVTAIGALAVGNWLIQNPAPG